VARRKNPAARAHARCIADVSLGNDDRLQRLDRGHGFPRHAAFLFYWMDFESPDYTACAVLKRLRNRA
jgi:hypothetical protein